MFKKILLAFSVLLPVLSISLFAQTRTGTVTNKQKEPVPLVLIFNKNTQVHAHSDDLGNFLLKKTSVGDTLIVSRLGFKSIEYIVKNHEGPIVISLQEALFSLEEVVVSPELDAINVITSIDIETNPVNSSQEILTQVPGLFIGQHAGGGKAEQIFLRGFDIDHGTDIAISADGIPVNMVSHAHGQGYADLHFLIPETVDNIDFGKGPYYANKGNFNTAGYVNFMTKRDLDHNLLKLETGQFNTHRLLGMFEVMDNSKSKGYVASEFLTTDGPYESPQNFNRINLFGKFTTTLSDKEIAGITVSHFNSKWDASGQVPQRAIDSGLITRFGAIDDTEGGLTGRTNIVLDYNKSIDARSSITNKLYYSHYDFELYSNFTFFLDDPVNGDQIRQKESRDIFGFNSDYSHQFSLGNIEGKLEAGLSLRTDHSGQNELSHTVNRSTTLTQIKLGDIYETNAGAYVSASFDLGKWMINPALRADYFDFQYNDSLQTLYVTQDQTKSILSPKLNILYNQSDDLQLYLKSGTGFHSNDTRVVVAQQGKQILPAAYGFDAGLIWKPIPNLVLNTAYWYLFLEQEFVYVGDAGVVEPSGKTTRQGVDISLRYQPVIWLFWNFDTNYTLARATEEADGEDYIPLAPDLTIKSGLQVIHPSGFYGGADLKHIDDRPANEDNSIVAKGYSVVDVNAGYSWDRVSLGFQIQNLFDVDWNETQFATESRLQNEANPVEEIHFTPGTPFFFKAILEYRF